MKKWMILAAGLTAMTMFAPASPSFAQGIGIDLPGVGVRIGEPHRNYHNHYGYYSDWDRPRVREREVYLRGSNCRTVTIQDDFGVTKRIRRCD